MKFGGQNESRQITHLSLQMTVPYRIYHFTGLQLLHLRVWNLQTSFWIFYQMPFQHNSIDSIETNYSSNQFWYLPSFSSPTLFPSIHHHLFPSPDHLSAYISFIYHFYLLHIHSYAYISIKSTFNSPHPKLPTHSTFSSSELRKGYLPESELTALWLNRNPVATSEREDGCLSLLRYFWEYINYINFTFRLCLFLSTSLHHELQR